MPDAMREKLEAVRYLNGMRGFGPHHIDAIVEALSTTEADAEASANQYRPWEYLDPPITELAYFKMRYLEASKDRERLEEERDGLREALEKAGDQLILNDHNEAYHIIHWTLYPDGKPTPEQDALTEKRLAALKAAEEPEDG